jgi:hypothetical protein
VIDPCKCGQEPFTGSATSAPMGYFLSPFVFSFYFLKNNSFSKLLNSLYIGLQMAFCVKQKTHDRFGLQTNKFRIFRVMGHHFGTLRRIWWQRRELKPIDHLPTINLLWPTPSPHALALVFEQWSIHASAGKSRSRAVLPQRPRVSSYRYLCLHFIFKKIIVALNF